jgi:hypothetical protein
MDAAAGEAQTWSCPAGGWADQFFIDDAHLANPIAFSMGESANAGQG